MMNKIISFFAAAISLMLMQSCVKDMQDDLNSGGWNHERSITGITFANQVGQPVIQRIDATTGSITVTLNVGAIPDMSKVKVTDLQLSYQATSEVKPGDMLDFSNSEHTASITVTSTLGETRTYTVYATEFRESLEGIWDINNFVVWGGTGPEYGGGRVYSMMDKSWCWDESNSPQKEYDNTLTFTVENITDDGNTEGTCVNAAGTDGAYADFIFQGSSNPATGENIDLTGYYRQIPIGESHWVRNYSTGTITFTDANGKVTTAVLESAGTQTLYNGSGYLNTITIPNQAFSFAISGTDEWTYIYTDYDVFARQARKLFIFVTKQ
jgi:hypothetical protein